MKILIVDDDKNFNERTLYIWEKLFPNATLNSAFTFDEAKEKLAAEIFDIVSLDAVLDGSNGKEADTATTGYGWHLAPFIQGSPQVWFVSSIYAKAVSKVPGSFGIHKLIFWGEYSKEDAIGALTPLNQLGPDFSVYNK